MKVLKKYTQSRNIHTFLDAINFPMWENVFKVQVCDSHES